MPADSGAANRAWHITSAHRRKVSAILGPSAAIELNRSFGTWTIKDSEFTVKIEGEKESSHAHLNGNTLELQGGNADNPTRIFKRS